ncbi:hypothetical protein BT96DRAFT_982917 [Gymnopus androsaceus JB14]|uniref:Uncharacterized protein n=1 Tax=Gymnopus androsaceus JB14 TaxID=1447944 RepID=A0A6A4IMV8_9AGAR|nr:hypothetical protein BT96DRAFT_982917 [Gymnopus androsaceus JB14]
MYMQCDSDLEWLSKVESPVLRLWDRIPLPRTTYDPPRTIVDHNTPNPSSPVVTTWLPPLDTEGTVTEGIKCITIEHTPATANPKDTFFCEPFLDIFPDDSHPAIHPVTWSSSLSINDDDYYERKPNIGQDLFAPSTEMSFLELSELVSEPVWELPDHHFLSLPEEGLEGAVFEPKTEYGVDLESHLTASANGLVASSPSLKRKRDEASYGAEASADSYTFLTIFLAKPHNSYRLAISHPNTQLVSLPIPLVLLPLNADDGPSRIKRRRIRYDHSYPNPWSTNTPFPSNTANSSGPAPACTMGLMEFTIDFSYTNNTPEDEARFLRQYNRAKNMNMKAAQEKRGLQRRLSLISC